MMYTGKVKFCREVGYHISPNKRPGAYCFRAGNVSKILSKNQESIAYVDVWKHY